MTEYTDSGLKRSMSIYDEQALALSNYQEETNISEWMTKRKFTLVQNAPLHTLTKGTTPNN